MARKKLTDKRKLSADYQGISWRDFMAQNDYTYSLSQTEIEREAKERGISVEELQNERWSVYYKLQREWLEHQHDYIRSNSGGVVRRNNTLDSFVSVFQQADRILTGIEASVVVNDEPEPDQMNAPAWNDGKTISFNGKTIATPLTDDSVFSLYGLNYHEVAHLLFTPRVGSVLGKWVFETYEAQEGWYKVRKLVEPQRATVFNILEDCRGEYLLQRKYPSVRPFLTSAVADYILDSLGGQGVDSRQLLADSFILLSGRKQLPIELRKASARASVEVYGKPITERLYAIVNEYRLLVFPTDFARAQELIKEVIALLPEMSGQSGNLGTPQTWGDGCGSREGYRNGKPATLTEQRKLIDKSEKPDDLLGKDGDGIGIGGENTPDNDNPITDFNAVSEEVAEAMREAIKAIKNDRDVQRKIRDTIKAIARDNSTRTLLEVARTDRLLEPTKADVATSRAFARELENLRVDSDPAWVRRTPSGKLNVRRAMTADVNAMDTLFDRWTVGNDNYEIEAVVLLDKSGSMSWAMGAVSRSAWVIKRGIEAIRGRATLLAFNHNGYVIQTAEDKALPTVIKSIADSGGTDPLEALRETVRLFDQSNKPTKVAFILSDGAWGNEQACEREVALLQARGVYVVSIYLGGGYWGKRAKDADFVKSVGHGADCVEVISKPEDLAKVARAVVRDLIKRN